METIETRIRPSSEESLRQARLDKLASEMLRASGVLVDPGDHRPLVIIAQSLGLLDGESEV